MNNQLIIQIFTTISIIVFAFFRLRVLMLFFQQEEYKGSWFLKLCFKNLKLIDKKSIFVMALIWAFSLMKPLCILLIIPALTIFALLENKFLKHAKKHLNITTRVKRILFVAIFFVVVISVLLSFYSWIVNYLLVIELLPFILVLGNLTLSPIEKHIQKKYLNEAKEILTKYKPIVIGITGSFGKTSTKHILAHILSGNLPVLLTPGSVNTEMGICRIIREKLQPEHKYFIVEMGAYFKGSIEKLCKFVNPQHGIITAVGQCHYEHFKTQETIAKAKFELGEWVAKNDGILIVNTDQINKEFIPTDMNLIKIGQDQNIFITDVKQERNGLYFKYHNNNNTTDIFAPIFGEHHAQNIAIAITLALQLGMSMSTITSMLKTLPQVNHRLEVKKVANDVLLIDDAYNSNPQGFKSAIDLLATLKTTRNILITPGMVELGKKHDEEHYKVGKYAGEKVDIVISILTERIPTFKKGFKETSKKGQKFIELSSFDEATKWMEKNIQTGDVILLENDLPDVYESDILL